LQQDDDEQSNAQVNGKRIIQDDGQRKHDESYKEKINRHRKCKNLKGEQQWKILTP
jgi:hypothetical protein